MIEKIIDLYDIDLLVLFGANNNKLYKIRNHFPDIKLVSRGNQLKILGSQEKIEIFELKFNILLEYLNNYNSLTMSEIDDIILNNDINLFDKKDDIIVNMMISKKILLDQTIFSISCWGTKSAKGLKGTEAAEELKELKQLKQLKGLRI